VSQRAEDGRRGHAALFSAVDMPESQAAGWIADPVVPKSFLPSVPDLVAQMPEQPRPVRHPGHARLFTRPAWSASSSSAARTCTCTHVYSLQLAEAAFLNRRASPSPPNGVRSGRADGRFATFAFQLVPSASFQRIATQRKKAAETLGVGIWTSEPGK
jgi:hypothetical protein